MSPRRSLASGICACLVAGLTLAACGSTPPTPSAAAPVAVAGSPTPATTPAAVGAPTLAPSPTPSPTPSAVPPAPLVPTTADLTGVTTDAARAHRLPIAVMLDDNRIARPQSGFNQASIVYQAPADGGEDRYMLVFQEGDSAEIGPVRSARVYFVHWVSEMKAAIAHYGGDLRSRQQLDAFNRVRFTNVDALGGAGKAFHRIASRKAPHNGYTSTAALRAIAAKLGGPASMPEELYRRTFIAPAAVAARAASERIRIPYQTGLIEYRFDRASDLYRRFIDGKAQVDPADRNAVTTRNVVVMFMSYKTDTKIEPGHSRPVIGCIGTGRAIIFREGRAVEATWSKADEAAPTRLLDATGQEIPLVTGRTYFQIVPIGAKVGHGS